MNKWNVFRKSVISVCLLFLFLTSYVFAAETTTMLEIVPQVSENEVHVTIKYASDDMCGGSFNFIYDSTKLELINVEEGESIKGITHFINSKFADGVIRANWVSTEMLPSEGTLINIKLKILSESFDTADISIDKLKIANSDGNKIPSEYKIEYDTPEEDNASTDNNVVGNNHSSSSRPTTNNSAIKQEDEIDKSKTQMVFTDVKATDWFYENVKYVLENKLMNGVSEDEFAPNNTLTRAMLVTVLYRNAGEPAVNKSIPFADVNMGAWYADAVVWAKQNGIVNGVTENEFAPDANITREQIATIMFRYAQYKGMDAVTLEENLHFTDSSEISEYAVSAINWAVGTELMKGKSTTTINPKDNATRAEIAAILQRFIENNK